MNGSLVVLEEYRCACGIRVRLLGRVRRSQGLQQLTPIFRPRRSTLLKLNDVATDLPAGLHLDGIDGSQSPLTGTLNQIAKVFEQQRGALVSNHRVGGFFLFMPLLIVPLHSP
jgi:hypothetical protein